ncbi:MAG: DNA repair protein RecO [Armatimonadia bacterium]|nr:DNA repair protein RecO [Armatimonadia bacterium]
MRERVLRTITLLRRDLGEADRLAVLLSREEGKLAASAKSSRKPGSKLAPLIEPFVLADCRIIEGRGEIQRLAGGEVVEPFRGIRADIERVARASLMTEIADQGTEPGEAVSRLYSLLLDCLRALSAGEAPHAIELYYLLHSTRLLGYGISLAQCASCGEELARGDVALVAELGGLACDGCYTPQAGRWVGFQSLRAVRGYRSCRLADALALPFEGEPLARWVDGLRAHVRYHMGVSLRSLDVLRSLADGEADDG